MGSFALSSRDALRHSQNGNEKVAQHIERLLIGEFIQEARMMWRVFMMDRNVRQQKPQKSIERPKCFQAWKCSRAGLVTASIESNYGAYVGRIA